MTTWLYDGNVNIFIYLKNYKHIFTLATKVEGARGWANGGISIFIKNYAHVKMIVHEIVNTHFILDFKFKNDYLRLAIFYWRPQKRFDDTFLQTLTNILTDFELLEQENYKTIFMGGFNARIKLGNNGYDKFIFRDLNLNHMRNNLDIKDNNRGNILVTLLDDLSYMVLNGRSNSDCVGSYTYLLANSNSTIDLTWINSACI